MLECVQAGRAEVSCLKGSKNVVSGGGSEELTPARQCPWSSPVSPSVHPAFPAGRGALTLQTLMQQKCTFEVFIWGTKASLYLDSGAVFKAPVQTELCLLNSSALSIHMPEIFILS